MNAQETECPPAIQAIGKGQINLLDRVLSDPENTGAANATHRGFTALRFAAFSVEATKSLLQHGANPFDWDPLNRTTRQYLEASLARDAKSPFWTKPGTRQNAMQVVELLKAAEKKWLETHPGADIPPPISPPMADLANLLAHANLVPPASPGLTG